MFVIHTTLLPAWTLSLQNCNFAGSISKKYSRLPLLLLVFFSFVLNPVNYITNNLYILITIFINNAYPLSICIPFHVSNYTSVSVVDHLFIPRSYKTGWKNHFKWHLLQRTLLIDKESYRNNNKKRAFPERIVVWDCFG